MNRYLRLGSLFSVISQKMMSKTVKRVHSSRTFVLILEVVLLFERRVDHVTVYFGKGRRNIFLNISLGPVSRRTGLPTQPSGHTEDPTTVQRFGGQGWTCHRVPVCRLTVGVKESWSFTRDYFTVS